MKDTLKSQILQRWLTVQGELLPQMHAELSLTPKLEKLIHILDWLEIERFMPNTSSCKGRPAFYRVTLARAFVAKAVLNIGQTKQLMDRLHNDRALKRICGFGAYKKLPSEATFSRAFDEFATSELAAKLHGHFISKHLGDTLICHLNRDGTAIEARERPQTKTPDTKQAKSSTQKTAPKRGRPRQGEVREPRAPSVISQQRHQNLATMLKAIPIACSRGTKCNAQGYKNSWNGFKLHIDTADNGIPIAALLSGATVHDSQMAIPLSLISQQRITNLYDIMDAAYCSRELREHSVALGHVPLIDHNPRQGEKIEFDPAQAKRYNERTAAERSNARLKDEFTGRSIWVKGHAKVYSHLMFGLLALSVDQFMRLIS